MQFLIPFTIDQINLVIKGIETLRDTSGNIIQYILQQVQVQAVAVSAQAANNNADEKPATEVPPAT